MSKVSRADYQTVQKRLDEEALYMDQKRKVPEIPWITISHDGQELLIEMLRSTIRSVVEQEVARFTQEVSQRINGNNIIQNTREPIKRITANQLTEEVSLALKDRDYTRTLKWTFQMDHSLCVNSLYGLSKGKPMLEIHTKYMEESRAELTLKAIQMRWVELRRNLLHLVNIEEVIF